MEERTLARIGAVVFVTLAITATAITMTRPAPAPVESNIPITPPDVDPLHDRLGRCQRLGEAGARDADCLAAWADSRRRFLTPGLTASGQAPGAVPGASAVSGAR